jgi:hypothetical protein
MVGLLFLFLAQVNMPYSMFAGGAAPTVTPTPSPTPSITPTPTPGTVVAKPLISPATGNDQPVTVSITCATSGATIFYTISNVPGTTPIHSGGTPQGSTLIYTGAFSVSSNTDKVVKAIGYKAGLTDSAVASETYLGKGGP